jgi:hypothetical protein
MSMDQFPKWLYHAKQPAQIVQTAEEAKALGKGWKEAPVEAEAPTKDASDKAAD